MSGGRIIGGEMYENNYDKMGSADQRRIDELFKKYPLKEKSAIDISISQDDVMKNMTGDDSKRVLTRMVVSYPDNNAKDSVIIEYFKRTIDEHCWKLGYEVDYEFPGHFRVFKAKKQPFTWIVYIVSKKNMFSSRDVYFGEKGIDIKQGVQAMDQAFKNIKKEQDFTKV